jgi:mRNA-degrading endonuclease RelE of RelBE toxin-antitoxin system
MTDIEIKTQILKALEKLSKNSKQIAETLKQMNENQTNYGNNNECKKKSCQKSFENE